MGDRSITFEKSEREIRSPRGPSSHFFCSLFFTDLPFFLAGKENKRQHGRRPAPHGFARGARRCTPGVSNRREKSTGGEEDDDDEEAKKKKKAWNDDDDDDGWHANRAFFPLAFQAPLSTRVLLRHARREGDDLPVPVDAKEKSQTLQFVPFFKAHQQSFQRQKKQNAALAAAVAATPTSSSSPSSAGGFKVALLGAGGGIGQPLGLLLKL